MIAFTKILLLAIASGAIAGQVHPSYGYGYGGSYGYNLGGSNAVVGFLVVSRVAAYHTAPSYSGYYQSAPVRFTKYSTNNGGLVVTAVAAHPVCAAYRSTPAFNSAYQATPIFANACTVSGLNGYAATCTAPAFAAYHVPAVSGFGKHGAYNVALLGTYPLAPAIAAYHHTNAVAAVQGVSRVSRVDPFHASHNTTVHTPGMTAVHTLLSIVAHVPAYIESTDTPPALWDMGMASAS